MEKVILLKNLTDQTYKYWINFKKDIKLRNKFVSVNPTLKPYFLCKDAIAKSGIYAFLKLIT